MIFFKNTKSIRLDEVFDFDIYHKYEIDIPLYEVNSIIIFNGANSSKEEWSQLFIQQIFENTKINEIIVYNYRGVQNKFGEKVKRLADYQLDLLANDFNELIKFLYKEHWNPHINLNIYLLGYSFGGFVIQDYLKKYKLKNLKGVIFLATTCYHCYDICITRFIQYYYKYHKFAEKNKKKESKKGKLIYYQVFPLISKRILQKKNCIFKNKYLKDVPFLYITCENDELFQYKKNIDCITQNYNNVHHVPLKSMYHGIMFFHPDVPTRICVNFFQNIL